MNQRLLEISATAAALAAADRSGLLRALGAGPNTADAFARQLGLDPGATTCVLEVLRAQAFVTKVGERYAAHDDILSDLHYLSFKPGRATDLFAHTEQYLRDGSGHFVADRDLYEREATYADAVDYLRGFFRDAAHELAARLDDLGTPHAILDVGAGSAVWSMAQVMRYPGSRVTAMDLPAVLRNAHAHAAELGREAQLDTIAGDFHTVVLPEARHDRVILANVLHLETAERAAALVQRVAPSLRSGGHLVVIDVMAAPSPARDRGLTTYALYLALRVTNASVHPEPDLRRWMVEAGLVPTQRIDLRATPHGLSALVARAP